MSKEKEIDHIRLYPSENGGHLIEHHFACGGEVGYAKGGPVYHEPEIHTFGKEDGEKVMAHLKKHGHIKV